MRTPQTRCPGSVLPARNERLPRVCSEQRGDHSGLCPPKVAWAPPSQSSPHPWGASPCLGNLNSLSRPLALSWF